jgi:hypothetical protein
VAFALALAFGCAGGMGTLPGNPHAVVKGKLPDGKLDIDNITGGPGMRVITKRIGDSYIIEWEATLTNTNAVACAYVCEIRAKLTGADAELLATENFELKPGETKTMTGRKVYPAMQGFYIQGLSMNPVSVKALAGDVLPSCKTEVIPFKAEARADNAAPVKGEAP